MAYTPRVNPGYVVGLVVLVEIHRHTQRDVAFNTTDA
jgi:hypothetical protein